MDGRERAGKAIVHVSGTLLRRAWFGKEPSNCIVVRPSGKDRDTIGYIVSQVKFTGPAELVYSTKPRDKPWDPGNKAADVVRAAQPQSEIGRGYVGTLPGFDNAVMVYLEADESHIHIQPSSGDGFISFHEFRQSVEAKKLHPPVVNPMLEDGC